jgi:predicted flap endonuclease-1-like 5' DNA nuclease
MSAIETMGLEEGAAKVFRLKAERTVEERRVNRVTGAEETTLTVQPFEVSIPLLALLPVPAIQLQEMNVEFGVEIVETKSRPLAAAASPLGGGAKSLAGSLAAISGPAQSNPGTMKVQMKIVKEVPEGIARMTDMLSDLLSGRLAKDRAIDEVSGVSPDIAGALKERGIRTTAEFLEATEKAAARSDLAKSLGVSAARIESWRKRARTMTNGE